MRGKLIVIEGTDCSGKETQTNLLIEKLKNDGYNTYKFSFPMYDTPTGKIVGGPYLGKEYI
ncbi:MAG: thymidylate kinase, partial [Bacilli bacterium]|nr:thymidylate kinase [Bacilli bacterium]